MSELTRQERFSMSRQFAKELVADSIITDAAAQFLALMIEEIHNTKIAPLQAELKRRTTLSAAMELPEVRALVDAAWSVNHDNLHGNGLEGFRKNRDRLRVTLENLDAALAAIKEPKT